MDSAGFKSAILNHLANCPGGRATLDDVRREVELMIASGDQIQPPIHLSALADVDIFQSGLVLKNNAGLQITSAGLSLLHSLESNGGVSLEISSSPTSQEFKLIDDLIGTEDRLRIFDLGLTPVGGGGSAQECQRADRGLWRRQSVSIDRIWRAASIMDRKRI
jgi:hypothetical protein